MDFSIMHNLGKKTASVHEFEWIWHKAVACDLIYRCRYVCRIAPIPVHRMSISYLKMDNILNFSVFR